MAQHNNQKRVQIIGYASCYGAQDPRCETGPIALKNLQLQQQLADANWQVSWSADITPTRAPENSQETLSVIIDNCKDLARQTRQAISQDHHIIVIGGDHSCAIGTWSGVHKGLPDDSQLGLIWIDAHMDSHTMHSSPSGAIHGMPVACLLGHGEKSLCEIESELPKVLPENLCLIGIRSYEPEEAELLNRLGVRIFYMDDVNKLGLTEVLTQAKAHISKNSSHFGISLDLDAIDPHDAPGVGSPESGGLSGAALINALQNTELNENFVGIEITELNSSRDRVDKTARLAIEVILASLS